MHGSAVDTHLLDGCQLLLLAAQVGSALGHLPLQTLLVALPHISTNSTPLQLLHKVAYANIDMSMDTDVASNPELTTGQIRRSYCSLSGLKLQRTLNWRVLSDAHPSHACYPTAMHAADQRRGMRAHLQVVQQFAELVTVREVLLVLRARLLQRGGARTHGLHLSRQPLILLRVTSASSAHPALLLNDL